MPDTHSGKLNTGTAVWPGGSSLQGPHRVGAFSICPQLEGFGYELNLRPAIEKEATKIGTLVHVGLAYRYGALLAQRPPWLVYPDGRHAIWICGQDRVDLAQEALRIYDAYCAHWDPLIARGVAVPFRPLLVEHQFVVQFPMPDGSTEPYTARIDLLAEVLLPTGREIWLIDHKTGTKLSNHTGTSYRADRQMLTGLALARAHGFNVNRVIINAMSREYPEPRFARFEVPISMEAYNRLGVDTAYVLQQMNDVRKRYPDPNNRPRSWDSCLRKYGRCLAAGTRVRTARGWLRIEDVVVGDEVVSADGTWREVEHVSSREYEGDVIHVQPKRDGIGVVTTPEHRLLVNGVWLEAEHVTPEDRTTTVVPPSDYRDAIDLMPFIDDIVRPARDYPERQDPRVVTAVVAARGLASARKVAELYNVDPGVVWRIWKNLEKQREVRPVLSGDKITLYGEQFRPLPSTIQVDEDFAELAGLFIAEGSTSSKIVFSFGAHETALIARCQELIQRVLGEPSTVNIRGPVANVHVSHTLWAWVFRRWFGHASTEKRLPTWLETAPFPVFVRALKGWIDGDGGDRRRLVYGITASPVLALQMFLGLVRARLFPSLIRMSDRDGGTINGRKIIQRHPTYRLNIGAEALYALAETFDVPRELTKSSHPLPTVDAAHVYPVVRRVSRSFHKGRVYDLSVPDGKAFLANATVVHNCDFWDICTNGQHELIQYVKRT